METRNKSERPVNVHSTFDFELHLAEHCNLNCAGCDHFSPLSDPAFPEFSKVEKDLRRIVELFGPTGVGRVHLLGGEPLLNPEIERYLHLIRTLFPEIRLEIVTNGLLLPSMPDSFWETCRQTKTVIRPTKYPIAFDYTQMERMAASYGVSLRYFNAESIRSFYKLHLEIEGKNNREESFSHCGMSNMCAMLKDGNVYTCPVIPNICHFNQFFHTDFRVSDHDFMNIYQAESGSSILQFLAHAVPFCQYCNIGEKEYGLPWRQSERRKDEWV